MTRTIAEFLRFLAQFAVTVIPRYGMLRVMKRFPPSSFYHWADPANLPSIRQHGLLSTERLTTLAGLNGAERADMLSRYRPNQVELPNGIIIRDQTPMQPALEGHCH